MTAIQLNNNTYDKSTKQTQTTPEQHAILNTTNMAYIGFFTYQHSVRIQSLASTGSVPSSSTLYTDKNT